MEDVYVVLKIVFCDMKYECQMLVSESTHLTGEKSGIASKATRQHNEEMFGDWKIYTTRDIMIRKVDMIVSTHNTKIAAC